MIPTTQRRYQTVEQALKVINDAEKFGGSVKVNKSGDLERSNSSTNPLKNFFLFQKFFLDYLKKEIDLDKKFDFQMGLNQMVIQNVLHFYSAILNFLKIEMDLAGNCHKFFHFDQSFLQIAVAIQLFLLDH